MSFGNGEQQKGGRVNCAAPFACTIRYLGLLHVVSDKQEVDKQEQSEDLDGEKEIDFNLLPQTAFLGCLCL